MIGKLLILLIRAYQVTLSPMFGNCCRFYPSCSNYGISAIEKHGCVRGLAMGIWRVLRCNPLNPGGVDFVPEPRQAPAAGDAGIPGGPGRNPRRLQET